MAYATIQPPFTLKFREMPRPELASYYTWYMEVLHERIAELEAAVRASPAYVSTPIPTLRQQAPVGGIPTSRWDAG